jgi:hypothetical protein
METDMSRVKDKELTLNQIRKRKGNRIRKEGQRTEMAVRRAQENRITNLIFRGTDQENRITECIMAVLQWAPTGRWDINAGTRVLFID